MPDIFQWRRPYRWIQSPPRPPGVVPRKVIVTGTRTFDDPELFVRIMDRFTYWFDLVHIVVGSKGHRSEVDGEWKWSGADYFACKWAEGNWWPYSVFDADWTKHGKKAGPIRNREMALFCPPPSCCVAFWDGKSSGTANMIQEFTSRYGTKRLKLVRYKPGKCT